MRNPFGSRKSSAGGFQGSLQGGLVSAIGLGGGSNSAATSFGGFSNPFSSPTADTKQFRNDYQTNADNRRGEDQGVLTKMKSGDDDYLTKTRGNIDTYKAQRNSELFGQGGYVSRQQGLLNEADQQSTDAKKVYTNDIQPAYKNQMESNMREAYGGVDPATGQKTRGAMTLQEAGDVNNDVQKSVRGLYDQRAQAVGTEGLRDSGVLSAMGAQALGSQLGDTPITGGQMAAMSGQALSQGSQAYAKAQQEMSRIREQGVSKGFEESGNQYERGERAKSRADQSIGHYQNADETYNNRMSTLRGERDGYGTNINEARLGSAREDLGLENGYQGASHTLSDRQGQRDLASISGKYGTLNTGAIAELNAQTAGKAGQMGMFGQLGGGLLGMLGGAGGMGGGSAGGGSKGGGAGGGGGTSSPEETATPEEGEGEGQTPGTGTEANPTEQAPEATSAPTTDTSGSSPGSSANGFGQGATPPSQDQAYDTPQPMNSEDDEDWASQLAASKGGQSSSDGSGGSSGPVDPRLGGPRTADLSLTGDEEYPGQNRRASTRQSQGGYRGAGRGSSNPYGNAYAHQQPTSYEGYDPYSDYYARTNALNRNYYGATRGGRSA